MASHLTYEEFHDHIEQGPPGRRAERRRRHRGDPGISSGWIVHTLVRPPTIDPVSSRYPPLTLCSRTTRGTVRAFAYVLPGG